MITETDVVWLDEHRLVSLAELVDVSGSVNASCSSSCTTA
jgi:hypothetical protein